MYEYYTLYVAIVCEYQLCFCACMHFASLVLWKCVSYLSAVFKLAGLLLVCLCSFSDIMHTLLLSFCFMTSATSWSMPVVSTSQNAATTNGVGVVESSGELKTHTHTHTCAHTHTHACAHTHTHTHTHTRTIDSIFVLTSN